MTAITHYFMSERQESLLFILLGALAIVLALLFISFIHKPFYSGIAYAIAAIALIQLIVGSTVYIRSPKDIVRVENFIQNEPAKIQSIEIPRMHAVMKNFELYKYIELALILIGIVCFLFIKNNLIQGIGLGLIIQSSIMLLLDFAAETRGATYLQFLQNL